MQMNSKQYSLETIASFKDDWDDDTGHPFSKGCLEAAYLVQAYLNKKYPDLPYIVWPADGGEYISFDFALAICVSVYGSAMWANLWDLPAGTEYLCKNSQELFDQLSIVIKRQCDLAKKEERIIVPKEDYFYDYSH